MGRRAANILLPGLLVPVALCAVLGVLVWVIKSFVAPGVSALPPGGGTLPLTVASTNSPATDAGNPPAAGNSQAAADAAFAAEEARIALYKRVGPAVVSIDVAGGGAEPGQQVDPSELQQSQGSGFLVDADGHIVTNNHVVEGADFITVTFANGKTVTAELRGTDEDSDLAVIKIPAEDAAGVEPIALADSNQVQVGQDVVAIGNPFGLENTMTRGIVSALGRTLPGRQLNDGSRFSIARIIQTDAAINPGNSGGPLLDSRGRLIGVNTAIRTSGASQLPSFEGVGFAVPSNTVAAVVPDLIATGKHTYAYLGVRMLTVTPLLAEEFDLPAQQGVLVTQVAAGSAAAQAGIKAGADERPFAGETLAVDGDIITAFDGQPIRKDVDLLALIADSKVGQQVTMTVRRGGETLELPVTLGARP
ncbi:MAG TPA: trypsin-like peptidase domain-containing protein [Herpetosiphonaceae bacterium]